jgi:uncharacterized protein YndB with AHSA1/START domain
MTVKFETSPVEGIIIMTHTLDAPRELVWSAFTDPAHVMKWYGGNGFKNPVCEMDVRPGGRWHHVMCTPDGGEHTLDFVFVEVDKPRKLSWQNVEHGKSKARGRPPTCLNILTLEPHETDARKTTSKFVARFSSMAERDMALGFGFTTVLKEGVARMNRLLKKLHAKNSPKGERSR